MLLFETVERRWLRKPKTGWRSIPNDWLLFVETHPGREDIAVEGGEYGDTGNRFWTPGEWDDLLKMLMSETTKTWEAFLKTNGGLVAFDRKDIREIVPKEDGVEVKIGDRYGGDRFHLAVPLDEFSARA